MKARGALNHHLDEGPERRPTSSEGPIRKSFIVLACRNPAQSSRKDGDADAGLLPAPAKKKWKPLTNFRSWRTPHGSP